MKFVGVDLTSAFARRPRLIDIAILDDSLAATFDLAAWPQMPLVIQRDSSALSKMILGRVGLAPGERAVLAVDGPQGLAAPDEKMRSCERILGTPGRTPPQLPPPEETGAPFQGYIRSSIDLFAALTAGAPRHLLAGTSGVPDTEASLWEVYPGAEWTVLASHRLALKSTPQGREERWQLFRRLGVAFPPGAPLPTADQLDALIGAYLAWCVHHRPAAVESVGVPPVRNGEIREGVILHATKRIREGGHIVDFNGTDSVPGDAVAELPLTESKGSDWNDDRPLHLMLTDYNVVHGTEPENAWLVPGTDYVLETAPPDKLIRLNLTHSATFPGGRGWLASPSVKTALRRLGYPTPARLGRANAATLVVRAPEMVEGAVSDLLRKHEAEAAYQSIRELLRECIPEITSVEVRVEADWDEPRWLGVVIDPTLPPGYSRDVLERQYRTFDERFLEAVEPALALRFFVSKNYPAELPCAGTNS
jgi:Protein of unknown function (DUF429)